MLVGKVQTTRTAVSFHPQHVPLPTAPRTPSFHGALAGLAIAVMIGIAYIAFAYTPSIRNEVAIAPTTSGQGPAVAIVAPITDPLITD
jgi:hypothetical protein